MCSWFVHCFVVTVYTNDTAGFATFGSSDWASSTGGTIQGLSSGAGYITTMGGTGQGQNMDLQADYTAGGNVGTTTLRFNTPGVDTVNINGKWIVVNAILVTTNMGADNATIWSGNGVVGGGMYFADYSTGNAQQIYIWQNNPSAYYIDNGSLSNGRNNSGAPLAYIQAGVGSVVRGPNCTLKIADVVNLSAVNEYPLIEIDGTIVTNSGNGFTLSLPMGVTGNLTNDASIIPGHTTVALNVTSIVPYVPPVIFTGVTVSGNNLVLLTPA